MFDTNVFNHILDGAADLKPYLGKAKFYATHLQLDEINETPDDERRAALLKVFEEITSSSIPTETFVLDTSRLNEAKLGGESFVPTESAVYGTSKYGQAKYSQSDNLYESITLKLKRKRSNTEDALIAETAIKNKYTFVTHDSDLFRVVTEFGGACANIHQVLQELKERLANQSFKSEH